MPWYYEMFDFLGEEYFTLLNREKIRKARREAGFILETLGLGPGRRVLDLCCGIGRHAIPLAKSGLAVTCFDHSRTLLEAAQREGIKAGVELQLVAGDMRELPWEEEFDAVINMWTSFGYLADDGEHCRVLENVYRVLKPGGKFLIDVPNRDWVARNFEAGREIREVGPVTEINEFGFDSLAGRDHIRTTYLKDGLERYFEHSCRLFTYQELAGLLAQAGLQVVKAYGSFDGRPVALDNKQLIILCRKPKVGGVS